MGPAHSVHEPGEARGEGAGRSDGASPARAAGRSRSRSATGSTASSKGRSASSAGSGRRRDEHGEAVAGEPASKRALRTQGRKTMRKLLDAAMVVFARRGYHAARVDDIVKVARTSHGTFYLYFSNKEDLLRALVAEAGEVVGALDSSLGPVGPGEDGWQELRQWVGQFSEAWQRYAPVLRAWTDLVMSDTELSAQAHAAAGGVARALAGRVLESGHGGGIDPNAAAEAVVAMLDRFHQLRLFAGEPVDAGALDSLTTMVHRGLFGGGDPPRPAR
jgi:AcrR family transcriptional regulator